MAVSQSQDTCGIALIVVEARVKFGTADRRNMAEKSLVYVEIAAAA